jgi:DNA-binding transcriptional regulator YdaS (Cro superfamily)
LYYHERINQRSDILQSTESQSPQMAALAAAVKATKGAIHLAARVGVSQNVPAMWKSRKKVPAEYCPAIERETGVRCEDLRPDVAWHVLRGTAAPAGEAEQTAIPANA